MMHRCAPVAHAYIVDMHERLHAITMVCMLYNMRYICSLYAQHLHTHAHVQFTLYVHPKACVPLAPQEALVIHRVCATESRLIQHAG